VRPQRARRIVWLLLHPTFSNLPTYSPQSGLVDPRLRASNENYQMLLPSLLAFSWRTTCLVSYCARRTSTFRACAFREQEDDQAILSLFYSKNFLTPALI
jgi:hypothetical protein